MDKDYSDLESDILFLKKEVSELREKQKWDISNLVANIIFPMFIYFLYSYLSDNSRGGLFVNNLFSETTTIILVAVLTSFILFGRQIYIYSKLLIKYSFKRYFLQG